MLTPFLRFAVFQSHAFSSQAARLYRLMMPLEEEKQILQVGGTYCFPKGSCGWPPRLSNILDDDDDDDDDDDQ